jgi:hypothetical protein
MYHRNYSYQYSQQDARPRRLTAPAVLTRTSMPSFLPPTGPAKPPSPQFQSGGFPNQHGAIAGQQGAHHGGFTNQQGGFANQQGAQHGGFPNQQAGVAGQQGSPERIFVQQGAIYRLVHKGPVACTMSASNTGLQEELIRSSPRVGSSVAQDIPA